MKVRMGLHFTRTVQSQEGQEEPVHSFVMYSVFFLRVCSGCCATVYLCNPSQETRLSSVATSQALLAERRQTVIPLLALHHACKCMGGNILWCLGKSARKSAFLLWDTYNHNKHNSFPTYGNPELLTIFFQENDIVTKIFLMTRMAAGLGFSVRFFF